MNILVTLNNSNLKHEPLHSVETMRLKGRDKRAPEAGVSRGGLGACTSGKFQNFALWECNFQHSEEEIKVV